MKAPARNQVAPGADRSRWSGYVVSILRLVLALTVAGFLLRGKVPYAIGTALGLGLSFLPALVSGACPPHLLTAGEAVILLSTAAGMTGGQFIGLFYVIPNYDKALHALNPVMLTFVALMICYELVRQGRLRLPPVAFTVIVVLAVLGMCAVWEVLEYVGDQLFQGIWAQGSPQQDPLLDTILDMAMNLVGGVLGAILATLHVHRAWSLEWQPGKPSMR